MTPEADIRPMRIGFISTRIAGSDGVSLEIGKWAEILERMGHTCFYIAGLSDRPPERTRIIPEAHFKHPLIEQINSEVFGRLIRSPDITRIIHETIWVIKRKLRAVISELQLDLIILENCVTIPLNIPLGVALVEYVMETGIPCIAHHHDFYWERDRFLVNAVGDYLNVAFPPALPQMQHVVINTPAAQEFSRRTGLPCRIIPNVMDFDHPPPPPDEYSQDLRQDLGLSADDIMILQPTRVVQRKGIEHAIELIRYLDDPRCKLVISHSPGDEGDRYLRRILRYAETLGVPVILAYDRIDYQRGTTPDGRKIYSVWDAYQHANFVTYPSTYEGFGNAYLEAIYFRKPILCNRYAIFRTDIEPCGFKIVMMEGFLTDETVKEVRRILNDPDYRREMVEHNYQVGRQYFSYARVVDELIALLAKPNLTPCPPRGPRLHGFRYFNLPPAFQ